MPKGRPRVPTNILDARGAFKTHPERRGKREGEPVVTELIGSAPKTFTADQLQAWKDITSQCADGVLTKADSIAVEVCAGLLARHRQAPLTGADLNQLTGLLGRFGMTPSDRSKVRGIGQKQSTNPFEAINK
jgi:hypothetical protein